MAYSMSQSAELGHSSAIFAEALLVTLILKKGFCY